MECGRLLNHASWNIHALAMFSHAPPFSWQPPGFGSTRCSSIEGQMQIIQCRKSVQFVDAKPLSTMTSASFFSANCVCIFLAASASARHIHRPQLHQHQRRQAFTITAFETSSLTKEVAAASITAGNDAIADIQQIQAGLSDLPADLLSVVQSVDARLGA